MSKINTFSWKDPDTLEITMSTGTKHRCKSSNFLAGGHKFFHAEVHGDDVHVLTGPKTNPKPTKRHIVNRTTYKGARGV